MAARSNPLRASLAAELGITEKGPLLVAHKARQAALLPAPQSRGAATAEIEWLASKRCDDRELDAAVANLLQSSQLFTFVLRLSEAFDRSAVEASSATAAAALSAAMKEASAAENAKSVQERKLEDSARPRAELQDAESGGETAKLVAGANCANPDAGGSSPTGQGLFSAALAAAPAVDSKETTSAGVALLAAAPGSFGLFADQSAQLGLSSASHSVSPTAQRVSPGFGGLLAQTPPISAEPSDTSLIVEKLGAEESAARQTVAQLSNKRAQTLEYVKMLYDVLYSEFCRWQRQGEHSLALAEYNFAWEQLRAGLQTLPLQLPQLNELVKKLYAAFNSAAAQSVFQSHGFSAAASALSALCTSCNTKKVELATVCIFYYILLMLTEFLAHDASENRYWAYAHFLNSLARYKSLPQHKLLSRYSFALLNSLVIGVDNRANLNCWRAAETRVFVLYCCYCAAQKALGKVYSAVVGLLNVEFERDAPQQTGEASRGVLAALLPLLIKEFAHKGVNFAQFLNAHHTCDARIQMLLLQPAERLELPAQLKHPETVVVGAA